MKTPPPPPQNLGVATPSASGLTPMKIQDQDQDRIPFRLMAHSCVTKGSILGHPLYVQ